MQITYFKNDITYYHYTNMYKNFTNYTNLTLKSEKQEMNYLNYSNVLWDCFAFHISGNFA